MRKMIRSTLVFCIWFAVGDAFFKEVMDFVPNAVNPLNVLYTNSCIEDLGCFYTGPPFFHPTNRPISLSPTNHPNVKFLLFTPSNPYERYELQDSEDSLHHSSFDPNLETKIFIHGFMSDIEFDDVRHATKNALLGNGEYNFIIVDWTAHNRPPYALAVANTRVVGAKVAKLVTFLVEEAGISAESVHIIGHSLGGHASGYAGERIPNLGRITGLDPAGPYFQQAEAEVRLDPTDANFVDVIHTDGGEFVLTGLGISAPIGHVDFYPNGGRLQTGCVYSSTSNSVVGSAVNFTTQWTSIGCDHDRANLYFLESITRRDCRFLSVQCSSYSDFEKGACPPENSIVSEMGFYATKIPGLKHPAKFFLRTNESPPFCVENSIYL